MLFIKAVDLVLDHIDDQLRKKLSLSVRDTLPQIERHIALPLMSTQLEPLENKLEDSLHLDDATKQADIPLKFGMRWSQFIVLPSHEFAKVMADNLSSMSLASNKLLILLRLRKNIDHVKKQAKDTLSRRESDQKTTEVLKSVDLDLLTQLIGQIQEAATLVKVARGLSETAITANLAYKCSIGETEMLLEKIEFFLKEHAAFCQEVDNLTKRPLSHPYALRDMLSSVTENNDFIIQCHLKMNDYILQNLESHSQYMADQKGNTSYFLMRNFFSSQCDPKLSEQKRQQILQFYVDLEHKTKNVQDPKSNPSGFEEAVLSCVDIYFGHARSLTPAYSQKRQRMEEAYNELHRDLLAKASSDKIRQSHKKQCQASKLLS